MNDDTEISVSTITAPAAWIYALPKNKELIEILSVLSLSDKSTPIVISPLLIGLTVEQDFITTVKVPISSYNSIVITKITSYYPTCFFFHGTDEIIALTEDHGNLQKICEDARVKFNIQQFMPSQTKIETNIENLCKAIGKNSNDVMLHITFTNGVKELLFTGCLIPCIEEQTSIQIGDLDCIKIPLYSSTVFESEEQQTDVLSDRYSDFLKNNGFYNIKLSETLYYYIFKSWGTALRFDDTIELIKAGLKQFTQDTLQTVKLAQYKKYVGLTNQKLTNVEKDHLMLTDAIITELGFSYAAEYWDSIYESHSNMIFTEWPIIKNCGSHEKRMEKIREFKLQLSSHVAANIFASNSSWYCTKLGYIQTVKQPNVTITHELLLKSIHFCNGLASINEDYYTDAKKLIKIEQPSKDEKYNVYHLAYICSTCPQLLSDIVWNLNRMNIYNFGNGATEMYNYIVNCSSNMCEYCNGTTCQSCIGTAFMRVANRFPNIPRQIKKEPIVITMFSRYFAEVDILGSFGKKHSNEQKEISKETSNIPTLDRMKFISLIIDYCKKNSWIDSVSGEDSLNFKNKKDFVTIMTSLTQCIDDAVSKFVNEMRKTQTSREQIENAIQSFNVETTPYAMAFSPLLTYSYYRVMLMILQNLALIVATAHVVDRPCTNAVISKWLSQQYQTIYGSFHNSHFKKGFLNMKTIKLQSNVEMEQMLDFNLYKSGKYAKASIQAKLCKLSVQSFRDIRIKNRPINVTRKSHNNIYFKRGNWQKKNPINGCLSFLLFKYHDKLFPDNNMSCLEIWQKIFNNSLPKTVNIGSMEEFDSFLKCVIMITDDYEENDVVDIQPESLLSFIECMFHNKFLTAVGYKEYISSLHGLITNIVPQTYSQFPILLKEKPKFNSIQEYLMHFKKMKIEGVPPPCISSLTKEPNFCNIFIQRSLVTFGLMIEKFTSLASKEVFQFGQFGFISGNGVDRHLNPSSINSQDYRYLRYKFLIATKLADVINKKSKRENIMFESESIKSRVMNIIENVGSNLNPELLIISEVMKDRYEKPALDDLLFYVDEQQHLAISIMSKIDFLLENNVVDFSINHLQAFFKEDSNTQVMYDFSKLLADEEIITTLNQQTTEIEDEPVTKKCRL